MLNIFDNIKLILENNQLKKENKELYNACKIISRTYNITIK